MSPLSRGDAELSIVTLRCGISYQELTRADWTSSPVKTYVNHVGPVHVHQSLDRRGRIIRFPCALHQRCGYFYDL